ncbi:hypothetical protein BGZ58_006586 [Dissophora ornata]|nr:hypothetical protein BGZ58_006586 [Dissophora ornata]
MLGQDDSLDSFSKRWNSTTSDPTGKDVIRIAYIPSMIGDSPIVTPESSVQHGGVLKPNFMSLRSEERNKHDSMASLDEAVVMAVTTNATPQVMKLNTIKATQSDLIQRSNTLHSSNSIKRSQSQRRFANKGSGKNPSPLGGPQSGTDSDMENSDVEGVTSAVRVRKASATSAGSDNDHEANPFMTDAEKADNTHGNYATNIKSSRLSNPFLSPSESKALTLNLNSSETSFFSSQLETPMSDRTMFSSIPLTLTDHQGDPLSDLAEGGVKLRPWASSSGPTALRDSTFSTISDSRSSTRGDGEEIMIFWDGHRDSKGNL